MELALSLPVVMLLLLGVVQVAVLVRDRVAVIAAAREAARAAAVSATPEAAARAAIGDLGPDGVEVAVARGGSMVRVTASYVDPTDVPLIGALLPDVRISATVAMRLEPP